MTIEKLKEALKILTDHNAWRRGDDTKPMTDPKALGEAIDVAQSTLESVIDQVENEYITIKKSDVPEGLGDAIKEFENNIITLVITADLVAAEMEKKRTP